MKKRPVSTSSNCDASRILPPFCAIEPATSATRPGRSLHTREIICPLINCLITFQYAPSVVDPQRTFRPPIPALCRSLRKNRDARIHHRDPIIGLSPSVLHQAERAHQYCVAWLSKPQ